MITGNVELATGSVNFLAQANLVHNRTGTVTSADGTVSTPTTTASVVPKSSSIRTVALAPAALLLLASLAVVFTA